MAIFIPVGQTGNYHGSRGEMMVYEAFKKLPDDIIIFYSVKWGEEDYRRTYRTGEADFLVFDPTRGFLVIEVKTGGIKRNDDGTWYSIGHDGNEHRLPASPLDQAWRSVDKFVDLLSYSDNETVRNYKVIPTVWFPNLKDIDIRTNLPSEYQPANTFCEADLELAVSAVDRAFHRNNMPVLFEKASKKVIDEVIRIFAPTFRIVPSVSSELNEKNMLFNQLTNEQATLLNYVQEQRIAGIHGASGTGKTMIALELARRLPKDDNILFLCFNKLLLQHLITYFAEELPNVTFANLNQLYARTGGNEFAEAEELTDFLLGSFSDTYQFDHIIIDEGQDFAADHLDILMNITKETGGYFYVFYDKNQLVHKWDQETLEWFKKLDCHLVLNKNCRNTYEIAKAAYSSVNIDDIVLAEHINGEKPCLNNYENTERAITGIAETIRFYTNKGFKKDQITILTLKTLAKTILAGMDSVGGYRLTNERDGDGILFTTARKFKGLESDVVIVTDLDQDCFKDDNQKCVFYVASSRAKHCLTYIASLGEEDMTKMIADLGLEPSNNPQKTLKQALNIDIQDIA